MNKYIGTWKLTKIAKFDDEGKRIYRPVEDYINEITDADEKRERQRTAIQLGYLEVNEDGTVNYKISIEDMNKTVSKKEIDEAFKSGMFTLSADGKFAILKSEDNLLHWEIRDDALWMDFDMNENGHCFAKATSDEDPDCIDMMVLFRYSKI